MTEWMQIIIALNTAGLFSGVIVGIRMLRHMGRLEERFDLVWRHFRRTVLDEAGDEG